MVEAVIGCHVDDVHAQSLLVQMVHIAQLHIPRQRRGALVVDVEADAVAVVFEIELIVIIVAAYLRWVKRQRNGKVAIVYLKTDGGILLGVQVVFRPYIVHCAFGMDVVTRLVDHRPQQPFFLRPDDIVRVVFRLEIVVAEFIVQAFPQTFLFHNGIAFHAVGGNGLGIRLHHNSTKQDDWQYYSNAHNLQVIPTLVSKVFATTVLFWRNTKSLS